MNQPRKPEYDFIRALALIFIVIVHSSERLMRADGFFFQLEFSILRAIVDTGVPLFVMLSGALLLGKEEPIGTFLKKRFKRIIPAFLFWSFVVFLIYRIMDGNKNYLLLFPDYIVQLLTNKIHSIYWFVYMIMGLYLITPVLRVICKEAKMTYLLIIVTGILSLLFWVFPAFELDRLMYAPFLPNVFGYLSGYALVQFLQKNPRARTIIRWVCLGIFILSIINRMTVKLPIIFEVFSAVGLFSLLLDKDPSRPLPVIGQISKYSYGIYLSHFILISAFVRLLGERLPAAIHPFVVAALVLVVIVPMFWIADKLHLGKLVN